MLGMTETQMHNYGPMAATPHRFNIDANLDPQTHGLCTDTRSFDFFVPRNSRPSLAWVKIKEDNLALGTQNHVKMRVTLFDRRDNFVESILVTLRKSAKEQPAILPVDWELKEPWRINFSYEPQGFHDHSCIVRINVIHCDYEKGKRNTDPVVPSTITVGQLLVRRRSVQLI